MAIYILQSHIPRHIILQQCEPPLNTDAEWKIKTFRQRTKHITNLMIKFEVLTMKAETNNTYAIFLLKKNIRSNNYQNNIRVSTHSNTQRSHHISWTRIWVYLTLPLYFQLSLVCSQELWCICKILGRHIYLSRGKSGYVPTVQQTRWPFLSSV